MHHSDTPPAIMIIDDAELDNVIFKMVVKRLLHNPNVVSCNNGEVAIDRLRFLIEKQPQHLPDYIFLDIRMPIMDGWQFLKEYKKLGVGIIRKTKIYILSSSINQEDIDLSMSNPFVQDYLPKPINLDKLETIFKTN